MKNNQKTTREIIEECAKAIQAKEAQKEALAVAGETTVCDVSDEDDMPDCDIQIDSDSPRVPICFDSEHAEKFCDLPEEWQDYLLNLDASLQHYCCETHRKMNELKWIDELYKMRDTSVCADKNETPREWLEKLVYIEHMLSADPKSTLVSLCKMYLRPFNPLERELLLSAPLPAYFKNRRQQMAKSWLDRRLSERHANGVERYPHRKAVMDTMIRLLSARLADDVSDAYDMAIWMDKRIRPQLIDGEVNVRIRKKADEARRVKNVQAMARTKGEVVNKPERELTTREIVEMAFRKHMGK